MCLPSLMEGPCAFVVSHSAMLFLVIFSLPPVSVHIRITRKSTEFVQDQSVSKKCVGSWRCFLAWKVFSLSFLNSLPMPPTTSNPPLEKFVEKHDSFRQGLRWFVVGCCGLLISIAGIIADTIAHSFVEYVYLLAIGVLWTVCKHLQPTN